MLLVTVFFFFFKPFCSWNGSTQTVDFLFFWLETPWNMLSLVFFFFSENDLIVFVFIFYLPLQLHWIFEPPHTWKWLVYTKYMDHWCSFHFYLVFSCGCTIFVFHLTQGGQNKEHGEIVQLKLLQFSCKNSHNWLYLIIKTKSLPPKFS